MPTLTTFDSTKEFLQDILRSIREGKTQLPDFQRGWVWDDGHVRSLLSSLSLSFPIGAVMMLEGGNDDIRFKPRPVEGVDLINGVEPARLILDGQQRLTSLFQALYFGKPVTTRDARGKTIKRWYYIDIVKALDPNADREDAILGLPEDRKVRNFRNEIIADYSSPDKEYKAKIFPLAQIFDWSDWRSDFGEAWNYDREKMQLLKNFEKEVVDRFKQYQLPIIVLKKETPKEAVCQVFEKVNTGGVSLSVFELLTATFAADDYNLRDDWQGREKRLRHKAVLSNIQNTEFLQALTLLATYNRRHLAMMAGLEVDKAPAISCKRKDVLRLSLDDYISCADKITSGFERAAQMLYGQKIFSARDLPYQTQLVPLAVILSLLGEQAENDGVRKKLVQWYWCGIFGELYGSAIESRFARDVPEVVAWLNNGPEPDTVANAHFAPTRLQGLRTRNSAAYKGLSAILARDGGLDFRTGDPLDVQVYFDEKIDIHHIFPQDWCKKNGIDARRCDSVVNKTPLSAKTNRIIGGNAPSVYLLQLQKRADITENRMSDILCSHLINPALLRADDFTTFFYARETALLERIEQAMGKPILRETKETDDTTPIEFEQEEVVP